MSQRHFGPERVCPSCRCRFSWTGRQWLIADREGRASLAGPRRDKMEPEPEILRCPKCHALLQVGAATVIEEESS